MKTPEDILAEYSMTNYAGAKSMIAALDAAEYVIVPKEPTDEQRRAGGACRPFLDPDNMPEPLEWTPGQIVALSCYRAMLATAPNAKKPPQPEG